MNEARLFTTLRIIYVFSFVINFAAQHDTASHTIERKKKNEISLSWT